MLRRLLGPGLACALACGPQAPSGGEAGTGTTTATSAGDESGPQAPTATSASDESGPQVTTTTGVTTGASVVCGDGVVEGDELCDDGNDAPGDGCEGCVPPVQEVWTRVFEGSLEGDHDSALGVAFTPDGRLYVVGCEGISAMNGGDRDIIVRRLDVDGTQLWERSFGAGWYDCAYKVAVTADDGAVVIGGLSVEGLPDRPWAARYGVDGDLLWTFTSEAPADDELRDVAVDGDAVFAVGHRETPTQAIEATIRRLDAASGAEVWLRTHEQPGGVAFAWSLALVGDQLVVVGEQDAGILGREATIQRWSADGQQLAAWTWSAPDRFETQADAVAVQSDGTIVISAATRDEDTQFTGSYLAAFDPDGGQRWLSEFASDWSHPSAHALAVDAADRVLAAGEGYHEFARIESVFGLFGAGGAAMASEQLSGDEILSIADDLAVHATGIVVVGNTCDHTTCDQWVRKFVLQ